MGMSIDTVDKWLKIQRQNLIDFPEIGKDKKIESLDTAISYLEDYKQLQADYETRLKADMVAMLEDLRLDFQEAELAGVFDNKELIFADEVDYLIQQKINTLKGDSND